MDRAFRGGVEGRAQGEFLHLNLSMVRQRIDGILADYEDRSDHDALRSDPALKLVCDRLPNGIDLASQPTLSRFENAITIADLPRLRDVLCNEFLDAFTTPPPRITLDGDAFDNPAHGQQQRIFFHGFYEQYPYLSTSSIRICRSQSPVPRPTWSRSWDCVTAPVRPLSERRMTCDISR
ncbi:MAG: transposase, partial [Planctomycetota bacterium]